MTQAASAAAPTVSPLCLPTHRLSKSEPRNVQGSVAGPPISIAATAMPAGGKIAVA